MTLTNQLADFFTRLTYDCLPKNVIEEAKLCLLDTLGCMQVRKQKPFKT